MTGTDHVTIFAVLCVVTAAGIAPRVKCSSCNLVPWGECQEGCSKSAVGCATGSKNGCKDGNKGFWPTHCIAPPTSFCAGSAWTQVWADEFDGAELDRSSWTKDVGPPGDSKTRSAAATAANVYVEDGTLVLRSDAVRDGGSWSNLTSGAVDSKGKRSFGGRKTRVCVRAKLPGGGGSGEGTGMWPAHWLMPENMTCYNEIDIMEMIDGKPKAYGTYWWGNGDCKHPNQKSTSHVQVDDFSASFHEYAVEFDGKSYVTFAFDGKPYETVTNASHPSGKFYEYNWYVILNSAVGGTWPGPPVSSTVFPTYHYIDYVRVSQQGGTESIV